jgi:hypothetical protein
MKYRSKPYEITYRRWTHKDQGYVVVVTDVMNFVGRHGHYATVKVQGSKLNPKKVVTWSAERFLKEFEPKGRRMRLRTALDQVLDS